MISIVERANGVWDVRKDDRLVASITQEAGMYEVQDYKDPDLCAAMVHRTFAEACQWVWRAYGPPSM